MYIYHEAEIRSADETANKNGLSLNALMETSGRSIYFQLKKLLKKEAKILILAGKGNNGGDGVVLARYLKQNDYSVDLVFPFGEPKTTVAFEHYRFYQSCHGNCKTFDFQKKQYDVIVDSVLGVGTRLPLRHEYRTLIEWCNSQSALKIAIDMPTGVLADSGETNVAFQANYTFCLHGFKPSAFLLPSAHYYGNPILVDIGLPQHGKWKIWSQADLQRTLLRRNKFAHKGTFGTGLLIAGSDEMPGSAALSSLGALKSGIGKLMIGTTKFVSSIISPQVPEATFWFNGLEKVANGELLTTIDAVAIGPGIVDKDLVEKALKYLLNQHFPLIVDAGALIEGIKGKGNAPVIITPHPGEFSRLIGKTVEEIQANRLKFASNYAKENNIIVVLKGTYTVIAFPDGTCFVNPTGNSGLAKGGSGDTLTGIILAMVAKAVDIPSAILNAVYLHGLCAEQLSITQGEQTIVASELTTVLGSIIKKTSNHECLP
ncbi:bifunctional ADP-dependent NAD(P)H-hydrate dehydratase/NAD(P)H-hydrate epimerase [Bacillus kwashiorkori]|uniref:bifunctional ADP-dependent NAD(P)H-hydrate dehydratase/NAD(P)H-hydrate epimerase n=1 Tax=Bacillus kwashiorkori TaxID=1522318 RepID=UPI000783B27B|nr:bifunctional ADP-dependent NAD(P)H-hydrate dehydratase/NAD(P)H-hydrate epimerase [Bacillus kwashiorkori]